MSPAMAARLETRLWDIADIVKLIEAWEMADDKKGICKNCSHPIGYHHHDNDACSVKDCPCRGYEAFPLQPVELQPEVKL